MRTLPAAAALALLLTGAGLPVDGIRREAAGQVVQGRLVDGGAPADPDAAPPGVSGAMMVLVNSDGRELARTITRASGLFRIEAPGGGRYRIRAERIGYATVLSDPLVLEGADTTTIEIVAQPEAISLEGIFAEGESRCRVRPEEGLAVTRVWEEARKALAAAAWTQERGVYRYEMMNIRRVMDAENRRVLSEDRSYDRGYRESPYTALPAEELMTGGFARLDPSESVYYAPDAAVLLSDPFLDTHCFRLRKDEERAPGLVGLAFQPLRGRRLAEISGTLWIDPATSELQWLDFSYQNLNLPSSLMAADIGGRVEFEALPNGTWIVDSWRIRMPRSRRAVNPLTNGMQTILDGITVQGGDVVRVHSDREGTVLEADRGGRITGFVFDSLQVGLPDANVYLQGTALAALTDRQGRFEIADLEPGVYSVTFSHPYIDRHAYVPRPFEVEIEAGQERPAQLNFMAPGTARILTRLCSDQERPDDGSTIAGAEPLRYQGIVVGRVTDEAGAGVPGALVRVVARDFDILVDASGLLRSRDLRAGQSGVVATTDAEGRYRACWVPVNTRLQVAVLDSEDDIDAPALVVSYDLSVASETGDPTVFLPASHPFQILDLRIGAR